jgi:hypothetical protein
MILRLDTPGMARLLFSTGTAKHGERRAYYTATAPARAVVVFRNGLDADSTVGEVVEAQVTTTAAPAGIARPGNEGKEHTIVSVTWASAIAAAAGARRAGAGCRHGHTRC